MSISPSCRSAKLRADTPKSLKAIIVTLGEVHYQACGALLHAVQTGSPAFDHVFGAGLFEYLDQNTDAANSFNEGMANLAGMLAYVVVITYDLGRVSSIVDVGGGNGRFFETILEIYPEIQGTVFDCPRRSSETANRLARSLVVARM